MIVNWISLDFGLLIGQYKTFKFVKNDFSLFSGIFIDQMSNLLIEKNPNVICVCPDVSVQGGRRHLSLF